MNFGEILIKARKKKNLTIGYISQELKIREKYLNAFENEDFDNIPPEPFGVGFLRKYLEYLEIADENILSAYKTKREGVRAAKYLVFKEEMEHSDKLIDKIKHFQMTNFWQRKMGVEKEGGTIISKILLGLFVVFIIVLLLLLNILNTEKNVFPKQDFAKFNKITKHCLEISVIKSSWISIYVDDKLYIAKIVEAGSNFKVFGDYYFKLTVGDIFNVKASFDGKSLDLYKGASKRVNTLILNRETIANLDKNNEA